MGGYSRQAGDFFKRAKTIWARGRDDEPYGVQALDPAKPVTPRFEDLRGILRYVPQFRQRVFVIALDGALIAQPVFASLLRDVAVLQSLNIEVVLVFGARQQVRQAAAAEGVPLSSDDGMGRTDAATMEISAAAIHKLASTLMAELTALEMPVAIINALVVHPAGVINGVDQEFTGRIERVDTDSLGALLKADIIPLLPPLGYDSRGATLRLNSDAVAVEVAIALRAAKIIFVAESGITTGGNRLAQIPAVEARQMARRRDTGLDVNLLSKLRYSGIACQEGVPRAHIVDGTQDEALLAELFSNEGVGTMIHADDYQQIHSASPADVPALLAMMQQSMDDAALVPRSREEIMERLADFFVLELDGNPIGCVAVHAHADPAGGGAVAEIACLFVRRAHKNRGHGRRLAAFAEETARARGCARIIALSTQAFRFFEELMGYQTGSPDLLPPARRAAYDASGRNSKVMFKDLES
jgi:amino-acid N-acetyltransferase